MQASAETSGLKRDRMKVKSYELISRHCIFNFQVRKYTQECLQEQDSDHLKTQTKEYIKAH